MNDFVSIESASNDTYRQLLRLVESSRERRRAQRSVIEGVHLLQAFADTRSRWDGGPTSLGMPALHWVFVPADFPLTAESTALVKRLQKLAPLEGQSQSSRFFSLPQALFRKASQVENGAGPIAVIDTPRPLPPSELNGDTLYLDRVQDPGNVGSILRTAAAAGIRCVLSSPGTAFVWAPKVLRAAMGAHFNLDIYEGVKIPSLTDSWLNGLVLRALVAPGQAEGAQELSDADLRAPGIWLVGNEGQGLAPELLSDLRIRPLTIDQCAGVESMNVAGAVAVALFEQRRQRRPADR